MTLSLFSMRPFVKIPYVPWVSFGFCFFLFFCWIGILIENSKQISFKELRQATDCFHPSNKIGRGGFGTVYKVWNLQMVLYVLILMQNWWAFYPFWRVEALLNILWMYLYNYVNIAYGSPFSSFACQFMDSVLDELHGRHVRKIWCSFFSLFINQVKVSFAG